MEVSLTFQTVHCRESKLPWAELLRKGCARKQATEPILNESTANKELQTPQRRTKRYCLPKFAVNFFLGTHAILMEFMCPFSRRWPTWPQDTPLICRSAGLLGIANLSPTKRGVLAISSVVTLPRRCHDVATTSPRRPWFRFDASPIESPLGRPRCSSNIRGGIQAACLHCQVAQPRSHKWFLSEWWNILALPSSHRFAAALSSLTDRSSLLDYLSFLVTNTRRPENRGSHAQSDKAVVSGDDSWKVLSDIGRVRCGVRPRHFKPGTA